MTSGKKYLAYLKPKRIHLIHPSLTDQLLDRGSYLSIDLFLFNTFLCKSSRTQVDAWDSVRVLSDLVWSILRWMLFIKPQISNQDRADINFAIKDKLIINGEYEYVL